jgi:hypothetical protein
VYFYEEMGIFFEIATDPPGFSVDEPIAERGKTYAVFPQVQVASHLSRGI